MQKACAPLAATITLAILLSPPMLAGSSPEHAAVVQIQSSSETRGAGRLRGIDLRRVEFLERYCFDEVNREREENGLALLRFFDALVPVARHYGQRMDEEGFFAHEDPEGHTLFHRLREASIKTAKMGEDLSRAEGFINPVPDVVRGWMKSPNHCRNILDEDFVYSAVGVWIGADDRIYFTQIFVKL